MKRNQFITTLAAYLSGIGTERAAAAKRSNGTASRKTARQTGMRLVSKATLRKERDWEKSFGRALAALSNNVRKAEGDLIIGDVLLTMTDGSEYVLKVDHVPAGA